MALRGQTASLSPTTWQADRDSLLEVLLARSIAKEAETAFPGSLETSGNGSPYNPCMATKKRHKGPPAGETGQEALYLKSLSDRQVPVTIKLRDGEMVSGWVEYFDDMMLRLTRDGKPNLFIYKAQIRTITEGGAAGLRRAVLNEEGAGL